MLLAVIRNCKYISRIYDKECEKVEKKVKRARDLYQHNDFWTYSTRFDVKIYEQELSTKA